MISIALYQPDIPQNTGAILRLGACLGMTVHIIEPTGFVWSDRSLKRAGMDYVAQVRIVRHVTWGRFVDEVAPRRIVLATTSGASRYTDFGFARDDVILMGRESAGVPQHVHDAANGRIVIPMRAGLRSLNVAMAAAMIAGEALRQIDGEAQQAAPGAPEWIGASDRQRG